MNKQLKLTYEKEINRPFTDNLTGVLNHGFFQIFLDWELKRGQQQTVPFTLGLIDIDSFSVYNSRHSSLKGDSMLQKLVKTIETNLPQSAILARYSGDIFAFILEHTDPQAAFRSAEQIRCSVEQLTNRSVTISIGLASFPRDATTKETLLQRSQAALYQAKIRGKNRVFFFENEDYSFENEQPKVLIVDDDLRNLKLLGALLTPLNFEVIKATNGQEALHIVNKFEIDLILLDVMMPFMDGFEVCRRIKANEATRMIPIILVTALDDAESKITGIEAGADDFLTKPPNRAELLARTRSLIKLKQLNNNLTSIENVLFSLANSIEAKDAYTQGHIERTADMAVSLGKKMDLSARELEALRLGSTLHDIGKLGIPGEILNKPGSLNPEEWELMKRHSEIGYKICLPLEKILGPALDVILHHHEKLDGSGYPYGLKGDEIPMVARIMAIVDIYDALITDRPYHRAMPQEKVLEILQQEALDGKLDQEIVANLIKMLIQMQHD